MIGERQTEAAEKLKSRGITAGGWVLIADRGAAGVNRGKPERDQRPGGAAEVENKTAAGNAYVVNGHDLETVAAFFIDVAYLYLFEDIQPGGLALFLRHCRSVWKTN